MSLQIRPAATDDVPQILALVRELAVYEREPDAVLATEADLLRDGFGAEKRFDCLMAEWEGATAGFALYFHNYSTWRGHAGIYLEDLYVRPVYRGRDWPRAADAGGGDCGGGGLPEVRVERAGLESAGDRFLPPDGRCDEK